MKWAKVAPGAAAAVGFMVSLSTVSAGTADVSHDGAGLLSLRAANAVVVAGLGNQESESTTVTTTESGGGYDLAGPYYLRSADPEALGEAELKFIYSYTANGDDDDEADEHEFELEFEWGMTENLEFIAEVPFQLWDGRVDGNGDLSLGLHIRHWHESGWLPAFATRHFFRLPTGYHSDGVDYTLRGLFTWTLVPDSWRLHFNPFLTSKNGNFESEGEGWWGGDDEGDERHFLWGAALGFDWKLTDNMVFIADYQNRVSEREGSRNQHVLELGGEWEFAEHHELGWSVNFGIDGDDAGADFGASLSYIYEFGLPGIGG